MYYTFVASAAIVTKAAKIGEYEWVVGLDDHDLLIVWDNRTSDTTPTPSRRVDYSRDDSVLP